MFRYVERHTDHGFMKRCFCQFLVSFTSLFFLFTADAGDHKLQFAVQQIV